MSTQYKENNFSTENISTAHTTSTKNIREVIKPNIEHLIKKVGGSHHYKLLVRYCF